jgi:hypothetical protein
MGRRNMHLWKILLVAALAATPTFASAQDDSDAAQSAAIEQHATFCDGTYALCIKAPCVGVPTMDRLGNYVMDHAACSCEVVSGWSMGPGACVDRAPVTQNGHTYLISTYSNLFNGPADKPTNRTLTCNDPNTVWAWCYGAPCAMDPHDPHKAVCNCPLEQSRMSTLGGGCDKGNCSRIWSAARPAADKFANSYFAKNSPGTATNPPAQACPVQ